MSESEQSQKQPQKESQKPVDIKEIMADYDKAVKFFANTPAEAWEAIGQKTAMGVFAETSKGIPAYAKFLTSQNFDTESIKSFDDFSKIPISDKYNYIQQYGFNEVNTVKAGKDLYSFSLSSGTIDEPTVWPRYFNYEEYVLPMVLDFYMRLYCDLDKKSTLLVNALALGPWTGGMTTHTAFRALTQKYNLTYATPGADLESIVQTIKLMGDYYDQVVMWAYPTFARTIMDALKNSGINIGSLNLRLFIGAEGHTTEWWRYINKLLCGQSDNLMTIQDAYGISEGGMPGLGTVMTNLIRSLSQRDVKLRKDIFGSADTVPDIFQYNPGSYYIENINGELVFTTKNTTPLVRYNVHDRGGVIKFRDMEKKLLDHGYDYRKILSKQGISGDFIWQQPFFFCRGRGADTVIVNGANIYPEQIASILFDGKEDDIKAFKLFSEYDNEQHQVFKVCLELKTGKLYSDKRLKKLKKKYHNIIVKQLLKVNIDYANALKADPGVADPSIEIYNESMGPFRDASKKTKARYIG